MVKTEEKEKVLYYWGTGRRKTSVARVRIKANGSGKITINDRPYEEYIGGRRRLHVTIKQPLKALGLENSYDVIARVHGGGVHSQIGAVRLGISRALLEVNPDYRNKLKVEGYLTRDPREKERKKYGQKRARKRFQFSKR